MFLSGSSNIQKAVNGPACRWHCLKLLKGHDSKLFACYAPKLSVLTLNMNVFVLHDLKWMAQCGEKRKSIQGTVGKGWDQHFLTRMQRKGRKRRTTPEGLAQWVTAGTWKESTQEKNKKQKQNKKNNPKPQSSPALLDIFSLSFCHNLIKRAMAPHFDRFHAIKPWYDVIQYGRYRRTKIGSCICFASRESKITQSRCSTGFISRSYYVYTQHITQAAIFMGFYW